LGHEGVDVGGLVREDHGVALLADVRVHGNILQQKKSEKRYGECNIYTKKYKKKKCATNVGATKRRTARQTKVRAHTSLATASLAASEELVPFSASAITRMASAWAAARILMTATSPSPCEQYQSIDKDYNNSKNTYALKQAKEVWTQLKNAAKSTSTSIINCHVDVPPRSSGLSWPLPR
jgi:hypothetical protein